MLTDDAAASRWLAARGGPADQAAIETITLLDVLASARSSLWDALGMLPDLLRDSRMLRRHRTNRAAIGLWHADALRVTWWLRVQAVAVVHLATGTAAGTALWTVGGAWLPALMLGLGCAMPGRAPKIAPAVFVLVAALLYPSLWWLDMLCLLSAITVLLIADILRQLRRTWTTAGPVLGFVPLRARLTLLLRGQWTVFATAVDVAASGRKDAAAFLDQLPPGALPETCVPVVTMARAHVLLAEDELAEALLTAREAARQATRRGVCENGVVGGAVLGWCLGELSRFHARAGDEEAAARERRKALPLLDSWQCRRHARRLELEELRAMLDAASLDHLAAPLREVHRVRWAAVRSHDLKLLRDTEMWLAGLMVRVGNESGAREALRTVAYQSDARQWVHTAVEESARDRLQAAAALVEAVDTRDNARRNAHSALALLDAANRPLAAVAARLTLSRADELDGDVKAALAQAVHALIPVHNARYRVSDVHGRRLWERMQLEVYATTLRLAGQQRGSDTGPLVAELMETVRGEVLPRPIDPSEQNRHLWLLDAASAAEQPAGSPSEGAPPGDRSSAPDLFDLGLSPVRKPPAVAVAGRRRLPGNGGTEDTFDLDKALLAVGGRCWYWSALTVRDRYYWAVRAPDGGWSHGWCPLGPDSEAAHAEEELRKALPISQPDEGKAEEEERVESGALSGSDRTQAAGRLPSRAGGSTVGHAEESVPAGADTPFPVPASRPPAGAANSAPRPNPGAAEADAHATSDAELSLLGMVSAAFLPPPLAAGLDAHDGPEPATVVVSLPAGLNHVPVAALPLRTGIDRRVVDVARVLHMPAWATVSHCLARTRPIRGPVPLRLAVLRPDLHNKKTKFRPPPAARHVVRGPLTRSELSSALRATVEEHGLLYLAGHVTTGSLNPALSGLVVFPEAGEETSSVSLADIIHRASGGAAGVQGLDFPMPSHVVAVGCSSLGLQSDAIDRSEYTGTSEWMGFGSALLLGGADHVVCTLYRVREAKQLDVAARRVVELVAQGIAPPDALRRMQLEHLERWRRPHATRSVTGRPFIWQSFAYCGIGGSSWAGG